MRKPASHTLYLKWFFFHGAPIFIDLFFCVCVFCPTERTRKLGTMTACFLGSQAQQKLREGQRQVPLMLLRR